MHSPFGFLLASDPPSRRAGLIAAALSVALCTLIIYPLKHVAPVVSLAVVYLPAVLIVSITWGGWLGVGTAVISAAAFNFFHCRPCATSRSRSRATGWRYRHSSWSR